MVIYNQMQKFDFRPKLHDTEYDSASYIYYIQFEI
jgi:hypothetical protein